MEKTVDAKTLENGKVLEYLISEFQNNKCEETLFPMLGCLRDSMIWVLADITLSKTDEQGILASIGIEKDVTEISDEDIERANGKIQEGAVYYSTEDTVIETVLLEGSDGQVWYPIFTTKDAISEENRNGKSLVKVPAIQILYKAHETPHISGLVINAYLDNVLLPFKIADYMIKMQSLLKSED